MSAVAREGVPAPPDRSAGAPSPLADSAYDWRAALGRVAGRVRDDRVSVSAASLAYHWFLALFPAVIALLGLVTLLHIGRGEVTHLLHGIDKALPAGASGVLDSAVRAATRRSSASVTVLVVGFLVALWSASSGAAVLQQTLDIVFGTPDRKFLARRARALPLMATIVVLGGLGAALIVLGAPIGSAIEGHLPVHGIAFDAAWNAARWVGAVLVMSVLFSAIYALGPNREAPRWRWLTPGGLLATAVFLVVSLGFSYYVTSFGSYGKTYGSFAGVAILIFWLYLVGFAVLLGGELNADLERRVAD